MRTVNVNEQKFDVTTAARLLHLAPVTIWREIKNGRLGFYRLGQGMGRVFIGESHLADYLAQRDTRAVKAA